MIAKNASFWNRSAGIYDGLMCKDLSASQDIIARIALRLGPESSVLEVATGTGNLALGLASTYMRIDAIDFAPKMIAIAENKARQKKIDNVRFLVEDAGRMPFPSESYDVVIIANALHIMPEPEKALREIYRVLKKDGVLIAPTFVHAQSKKAAVLSRIMGIAGFRAYHRWTQ
jgi:phosphatidylethanolamine/phosphatidyl-N-methylethanolamine N-methyltransferase